MMKPIALILSLAAFAALTGCGDGGSDNPPTETTNVDMNAESGGPTETPQPPPALGAIIGHVSNIYEGENAFVGEGRATEKQPIHLNEHFYTGAGTKMEITLDNGAVILLDQNTDPFFTTAKCFWIRLTSGTMTVRNKDPMCTQAGPTKSNQHSYALYQANGGATTIAVFEGEVTTISPPGYTVRTGQILYVRNGETPGPQPMSQDTINQLQGWIPRIIL